MQVIRREKRVCPCCMEEHVIETVFVEEQASFKNRTIVYTAEYDYCANADEFYMSEAMISKNDIRMKDAYRKASGLLTSDEIIGIRQKYGISQSDLCTLLGWGGKTITRYESHQVQDKAHDTILRKLDQDPEWFLALLEESRDAFSLEGYTKYTDTAQRLYEEMQDAYLRKVIRARYARFYNQPIFRGNMELSLDKVVDVIRYFSNSEEMRWLYKVKLMKLLWYADVLSYKRRGHGITGLVYQSLPMGAVPVGHDCLIDLKGITYEEMDMGEGTAYRFCPAKGIEYPALLEEEREILDTVIAAFGKMTKDQIVQVMHKERAYKETLPLELISFEYAKDLSLS